MIKNCKVLLNNDAVTVVDFDGVQVQFPAIHRVVKTINVNNENGKYSVVEEGYIEPLVEDFYASEIVEEQTNEEKPRRRNKKKTTSVLEEPEEEYLSDGFNEIDEIEPQEDFEL